MIIRYTWRTRLYLWAIRAWARWERRCRRWRERREDDHADRWIPRATLNRLVREDEAAKRRLPEEFVPYPHAVRLRKGART